LIIDSDPQIGRGLKRALRSQHVTLTADYRQARSLLDKQRYDAVLCDLLGEQPPGLDLYHDALKRDPEQARRFVFMTGGALTQRTQRFLSSVNNPRLEKPFSIADFLFLLQGLQAESATPAI
jgi:DNA-binding response OmpR family regulator